MRNLPIQKIENVADTTTITFLPDVVASDWISLLSQVETINFKNTPIKLMNQVKLIEAEKPNELKRKINIEPVISTKNNRTETTPSSSLSDLTWAKDNEYVYVTFESREIKVKRETYENSDTLDTMNDTLISSDDVGEDKSSAFVKRLQKSLIDWHQAHGSFLPINEIPMKK